jgi:hypothetical protein
LIVDRDALPGIAESDSDEIAEQGGDMMKNIGLTAAEKFW